MLPRLTLQTFPRDRTFLAQHIREQVFPFFWYVLEADLVFFLLNNAFLLDGAESYALEPRFNENECARGLNRCECVSQTQDKKVYPYCLCECTCCEGLGSEDGGHDFNRVKLSYGSKEERTRLLNRLGNE